MAIITMLVGLGVLLAFTVLGCVLEVFLARRESIWPGLVLPILAGLFGHPGFFAADGVLYLPQRQAPEKAAGKNECAGSVMPACGGILCIQRERRPVPGHPVRGAVLLRRSFIFRMQKVRDAAQKQKAADDAGLHAEGAAF